MALYKSLVKKVSIPADKKTKQKEYEEVGQLAIIDQGKKLIGGYTNNFNMQLECTLPVIIFGDHTCAVKYVDFPFGAGADGIKVLSPKDEVLPKYLFYGTQYLTLRFPDRGYARHYQHIEKMDLRLPELEEQLRIVKRIEELFSELDKGVETLQIIKQQLTVYKQAVLKEALLEQQYPIVKIRDACSEIVDCPHSTPKWVDTGYLCLRTTNFKRGFLDLTEPNYVSEETFNIRNKRLVPRSGDILYSREGSILGIACVIPEGITPCLGQRMMLLRASDKLNNKFLMHYLNSPMVTNHVITTKGGTGSPHINVGDIKNFDIPIPSIEQQERIVALIEKKFSICDSIEQTVDTAFLQAEAMRQSILKKAFEGELSE